MGWRYLTSLFFILLFCQEKKFVENPSPSDPSLIPSHSSPPLAFAVYLSHLTSLKRPIPLGATSQCIMDHLRDGGNVPVEEHCVGRLMACLHQKELFTKLLKTALPLPAGFAAAHTPPSPLWGLRKVAFLLFPFSSSKPLPQQRRRS